MNLASNILYLRMEIKPVTRNTQHVTRNKKLILVLKLLVSAGILFFLSQKIDMRHLLVKMLSMKWSYLVACLFLFFLSEILHSLRWKLLLGCKKIEISVVKLLYFNFVGLFYSLFLPSSIGGDAVRMYQMSRYSQNTSEGVASVFMERGIGFFALICVAPIMVLFSSRQIEASALFFPVILLLFCAVATIYILFRLKGMIRRWCLAKDSKFLKKIGHYYDVFDAYRNHKKTVLLTMVISLGMIFLGIFIKYMISQGLSLYVPLAYFVIYVPIIVLITMVPISIHGFGLREGACVYFFAKAGLSAPEALSISLISYVLALIFGIIGGMAYVVNGMQAFDRINKIINPVHPVHPVKK